MIRTAMLLIDEDLNLGGFGLDNAGDITLAASKKIVFGDGTQMLTAPVAATAGSIGLVKPDGTSITIDPDGTLHASGSGGGAVDSFNGRAGVVTLLKADVEGVLTGTITSHDHDGAYATAAHNHAGVYLPTTGGALSGFLFLHADPTLAFHAATKGYVDTVAATISGGGTGPHTHAATDVISGTFDVARIPDLPTSKITSGVFDISLIPDITSAKVTDFSTAVQGVVTSALVLARLAGQSLAVATLQATTLAPTTGLDLNLLAGTGLVIAKSGGYGQLTLTGGASIVSSNNASTMTGFGSVTLASGTGVTGFDANGRNITTSGGTLNTGGGQLNMGIGNIAMGGGVISGAGGVSSTTFTENGVLLSSKYAPIAHTHSYLSTGGGTLTGALNLSGTGTMLQSNNVNVLSFTALGEMTIVAPKLYFGATTTIEFPSNNELRGVGSVFYAGAFLYSGRKVGANAYGAFDFRTYNTPTYADNGNFANIYARAFSASSTGGTLGSGLDVAEFVPNPDGDLEGGDLAVIDDNDDEAVKKHTGIQYDKSVAGVVSISPGFTTGEYRDEDVEEYNATYKPQPLALAGRVLTKVTTTYIDANGQTVRRPIQRGFLLVASSIPGHAMAADPSDFANGSIPPGSIVGKAMQPFDPDPAGPQEGMVKVWVNLG